MNREYSITNQCLQLLKQSNLPTIMRLRVEIRLIQMKKLLLNDALTYEVKSEDSGEDVFEGLLGHMRRICGGNSEGDALAALMERLGGMLTYLDGKQQTFQGAVAPAGSTTRARAPLPN